MLSEVNMVYLLAPSLFLTLSCGLEKIPSVPTCGVSISPISPLTAPHARLRLASSLVVRANAASISSELLKWAVGLLEVCSLSLVLRSVIHGVQLGVTSAHLLDNVESSTGAQWSAKKCMEWSQYILLAEWGGYWQTQRYQACPVRW